VIEFLFQGLGLVPGQRKARVAEAAIIWNYTTVLNIVFLAIAALPLFRFFATGGPQMLRMMNKPSGSGQRQVKCYTP
jgi:hypothetical protein